MAFDEENESSVPSRPTPFVEGKNQIKIAFTPKPTENPQRWKVRVELMLSRLPLTIGPRQGHDFGSPLKLIKCETRDELEESNVTVTFVKGQPDKIQIETDNWDDTAHKHLVYQMNADGDVIADVYESDYPGLDVRGQAVLLEHP